MSHTSQFVNKSVIATDIFKKIIVGRGAGGRGEQEEEEEEETKDLRARFLRNSLSIFSLFGH